MAAWLSFALTAFVAVFSIVDPIALAPIFISITPNDTEAERRRMARLATVVACAILLVFAFAGSSIFELFGISTAAFRVAGGILLLMVAMDMLRAKETPTRNSPEETEEGLEKADVAITPVAIPLLAGPGALSTVSLLATNANGWVGRAIVALAIVATCVASWLILANAARLMRVLGRIGMKILTRVMGLLLAGIAAEFVLAGVKEFWGG